MIDGYVVAAYGDYCTVCVSKKVEKVIRGAETKDRRRVGRLMQHLAELGPGLLNNDQLKHEGKFGTGRPGGGSVSVWVFRGDQLRVYGGYCEANGAKVFVCDGADIKKQDEADQALLNRVAKMLGERHAP